MKFRGSNRPSIHIGLVVRNGERHIADAIRSWRAQTRTDWRLVVYDNASTDDTAAIIEQFARRDPRIRLVRHAENIGMTGNFRYALAHAESPLFCWSAADDLREQMFLERMMERLAEDGGLIMSASAARCIAPDGAARGVVERDGHALGGLSSDDASLRIRTLLREPAYEFIFGVMRTDAAQRTLLPVLDRLERRGGRPQFGGDVILMAALAAKGRIAVDSDRLLVLRDGGHSHRRDAHHGLTDLLRDLVRYRSLLSEIIRSGDASSAALGLNAHWLNVLAHPSMRRRMLDHLSSMPTMIRWFGDAATALRHPALRRLRARLRAETDRIGQTHRIMLSGGGQHTARRLGAIRRAVGRYGRIVGILDERDSCLAAGNRWRIPRVAPSDAEFHGPTLIIASSDAYEPALFDLALRSAPDGCAAWALYDLELESARPENRRGVRSAYCVPQREEGGCAAPGFGEHIDGAA